MVYSFHALRGSRRERRQTVNAINRSLGRIAVLRANRAYRLRLMLDGCSPSMAAAIALTRARFV
jgi:hypothetical protein